MSLKDRMNNAAQEHGLGGNKDFFSFDKSGQYVLRVLSEPTEMATHFFGKGTPGSVCYGKAKGCPFHGPIPNLTEEQKTIRLEAKKSLEYDTPSVKFQCYVIDRADGKVKLAEIPWSVVSVLSDFEEDPDWGYSSYPLPYDVRVTVDKENKDPKSIYKTLGVPRREPVTIEEENEYLRQAEKLSVEKYIESRKSKQLETHKERGIWITEEDRARREQDRLAEGAAVAEAHGLNDVPAIEYPENEINPEDIPF